MSRIFLGWNSPALPAAADVLLRHYGDGRACRMAGALIVVPGARAGRRYKEILEERARQAGIRLVPPRVITIGALPEELFAPGAAPASSVESRLCWMAALQEIPPEALTRVFARRPEEDALAAWASLAAVVGRLHREVAGGGHRFADVARMFKNAGGTKWDDAERWIVLAEVQERYEARLAGVGLADRDLQRLGAAARIGADAELERPRTAARVGVDADLEPPRTAARVEAGFDIWLVGVVELPAVTRQLLEQAGERVRALVHAPETMAGRFDGLGCVRPEAWEGVEIPLEDDRIAVADKPGDQADVIARFLADLGGSHAPDDIVVGVSSGETVPWIEERLSTAGVAVRNAAGVDPSQTPPFRLLAAVADALDDDRWPPFAALARHPDVVDRLADHDPDELLACADRWYQQHLPERLPTRHPGWDSRDGEATASLVSALRELLAPLRRADRPTLKGWIDPVIDLLIAAYKGRSWRADRPSHRVVIRALEQLGGTMSTFRSLRDGLDVECTASAAIRMVLDRSGGDAIPHPQDHAAVELLGWLELHMDDAPVTVIAGANEPWLPESVTHDAFLPNALRTRLGLADNRFRYARDAYRLTAIAHSRERLLVVAGRWDADGDPLRPSRLLFAARGETVARRVRRFYDPEYAPEPAVGTGPVAATETGSGAGVGGGDGAAAAESDGVAASTPDYAPPRPGGFTLPPEPEIELGAPPATLPVTSFRMILQDPYGWALVQHRGCEPIDDHAREMDGRLFGSLAHTVLERFGRDASVVHLDDERAVVRRLDELLDRRVDQLFGSGAQYAHVAVRVQVEQLRSRLRRFAAWHVGWVNQGWRVAGVEVSTPRGGAAFDVDGVTIGLSARIDRVDFHPGRGEWALLDYKTGDKARDPGAEHRTKEGAWVDLQLPLYHWLLPLLVDESGAPRFEVAQSARVLLGYVPVSAGTGDIAEALVEWTVEEMEGAIQTAREAVRWLRSGTALFDPDRVPKYADARLEALLGLGLLSWPAEDDT